MGTHDEGKFFLCRRDIGRGFFFGVLAWAGVIRGDDRSGLRNRLFRFATAGVLRTGKCWREHIVVQTILASQPFWNPEALGQDAALKVATSQAGVRRIFKSVIDDEAQIKEGAQ